MNVVLAFLLLFLFYAAIGEQTATSNVGQVAKGYPAAGVLKEGDKVVAVDGKRGSLQQFLSRINSHKCAAKPAKSRCKAAEPASITVVRDGERRTFELTPIYDAESKRMRLGFQYAPGPRETFGFARSLDISADHFWFITKETAKLPLRIIDSEQRKEISGVVGAYETTRQTILDNVADVVRILAVISLSLALVNLFPFLPLDGGHIFWAVVEKVRRRPVPFSVMERAGVVGFMLVIGLFLIGFTNDIGRLSGEGFEPR